MEAQKDIPGNTSGHGVAAQIPPEIRGWNWGAFFLNWIWGIRHNTYIALLAWIPLVNFVMPFVLGAKGNEWAWRNKTWASVEEFKKTQKRWAWSGLVVVLLIIPSLVGGLFLSIKGSDAYQMSLKAVTSNKDVIAAMGQPLTPGFFVTGQIDVKNSEGLADIQYSLTGPSAKGDVAVHALEHAGIWRLKDVSVTVAGRKISVVHED